MVIAGASQVWSPCSTKYAGAKYSWMSGAGSDGSLRKKPPASPTLLASFPLPSASHRSRCRGSSASASPTCPPASSQVQYAIACSIRPSPTAGRSRTGRMPTDLRCSAGPRPECWSSAGVLNDPAQRTVSPDTATRWALRPRRSSTPTTRPRSTTRRVAWVRVRTSRPPRLRAPRRYASAAVQRRPRRWVTW